METSSTSRRVRRSALVAATMASFLTPYLGSSINVALPAIGSALGMNAVDLSWVAIAFILASAVCLVPFGRVADMIGRKKVFLTGMGLFTLSSLGCGLAQTASMLIALRGLQGVGAAMIFGTGLAILTSVYPAGERGRVIGLNAAAVYTGLSVGPFLGGLLTHRWGWPSVFLASVPFGLAAWVVAWKGLEGEWRGDDAARFDGVGAVLYALILIGLMLGLAVVHGTAGLLLVGAAGAALIVFLHWEKRVKHPVFEVGLLAGNLVFARSNLAALINYSATYAVTFLLSLHLQVLRGLDPRQAGMVLLAQSIVMAAVSPIAGRLSDRLEPRIVASLGMGLTILGLIWFALLPAQAPLAATVAGLLLLGAGFGLFSSPNTNAVMSSVEKRNYGIASATLGTMRLVGQMLSMGVAAAVLAAFVGRAALTPDLHPRFLLAERVIFLLFAGLCVLGTFASLSRGNVRPAGNGNRPIDPLPRP